MTININLKVPFGVQATVVIVTVTMETDKQQMIQQMLMPVMESTVRMVEHVWMEIIPISVIAQMDSRGITVRIILH